MANKIFRILPNKGLVIRKISKFSSACENCIFKNKVCSSITLVDNTLTEKWTSASHLCNDIVHVKSTTRLSYYFQSFVKPVKKWRI